MGTGRLERARPGADDPRCRRRRHRPRGRQDGGRRWPVRGDDGIRVRVVRVRPDLATGA